jgi:hypothetical protein
MARHWALHNEQPAPVEFVQDIADVFVYGTK